MWWDLKGSEQKLQRGMSWVPVIHWDINQRGEPLDITGLRSFGGGWKASAGLRLRGRNSSCWSMCVSEVTSSLVHVQVRTTLYSSVQTQTWQHRDKRGRVEQNVNDPIHRGKKSGLSLTLFWVSLVVKWISTCSLGGCFSPLTPRRIASSVLSLFISTTMLSFLDFSLVLQDQGHAQEIYCNMLCEIRYTSFYVNIQREDTCNYHVIMCIFHTVL